MVTPDMGMRTTEGQQRPPRPARFVVRAFALAVLVGAGLLLLPCANRAGTWGNPLTALFTATSAVCVTGLTVVDTGGHFSHFGQGVILALMQMGGLGIMTMGTFLLLLTGSRLSLSNEFVLLDALGTERARGLRGLVAATLAYTALIEGTAAVILAARFVEAYGYPWPSALYQGLFHAVSAFCNAGFALYPDNLVRFRADAVVVSTLGLLIVLGGLGFTVLYNLSFLRPWRRNRRTRGRLTLHARVVLTVTGVLLAAGFAGFLATEWTQTLAGLPLSEKLLAAGFQAVTPRTAGFNVVDMAALRPATHFFTMFLMFIGGSPASTAGGIKTTTLAVLIMTMVTMVRGREDVEIGNRCLPGRAIREALVVFVSSIGLVCLFFGVLLITEHVPLLATGLSASDRLLFETMSAFCTVGLSTGITPDLTPWGKLCLVACMFIGRVGPLSLALVVGGRAVGQRLRYPEEDLAVG